MLASEWYREIWFDRFGEKLPHAVEDLVWKDPYVRVLLYWKLAGRTGLSPLVFKGLTQFKPTLRELFALLDAHPNVTPMSLCWDTRLPIYKVDVIRSISNSGVPEELKIYTFTTSEKASLSSYWGPAALKGKEELLALASEIARHEPLMNFQMPGAKHGRLDKTEYYTMYSLFAAEPDSTIRTPKLYMTLA